MADQGVSIDLRVYKSNTRNSVNILSGRTGIISDNGQLDEKEFKLEPSQYYDIPQIPNGKLFIMYSYYPLTITGSIGVYTDIEIPNQTLFVITTAFNSIKINNVGSNTTKVKLIKFYDAAAQSSTEMERQLVTFDSLSRITELPQAVVNPLNFVVQDVTESTWTRDQTTSPGTGSNVTERYRICDSDGTPNLNGSYIMILDDNVSQQNFSGTLELWVSETTV